MFSKVDMRFVVVFAVSISFFSFGSFVLAEKQVPLSRAGGSKGAITHRIAAKSESQSGQAEEAKARPNLNLLNDGTTEPAKKVKIRSVSRSGGSAGARKIRIGQ